MKLDRNHLIPAVLGTMLVLGGLTLAGAQAPTQSAQPDNTKVNAQDKDANSPTADQQKMDRPDREITKEIRKSIIEDKSLSTYGHNVKIITQNGMVTLKGPVRSEEEKKAIEDKAAQVAGADKVTDDLQVKSKQ